MPPWGLEAAPSGMCRVRPVCGSSQPSAPSRCAVYHTPPSAAGATSCGCAPGRASYSRTSVSAAAAMVMISRMTASRGHGRYTALSGDVASPKYRSVRLTRRSRVVAQCIKPSNAGSRETIALLGRRFRLDAPGRAVRDEMGHLGRPVTQKKGERLIAEVALGEGHAFELAQVFYPRI